MPSTIELIETFFEHKAYEKMCGVIYPTTFFFVVILVSELVNSRRASLVDSPLSLDTLLPQPIKVNRHQKVSRQ